jgi:hypothetical protein
VEDLGGKDAAAIREGYMVLATIGLERRRDDGVWVRKAEKINFVVPWMSWVSTRTSRRSPTRRPGSGPPTCGAPRSKRWPYDHGIKHTGYVLIRDMGGERRRVFAELVSIEPSGA